MEQTLVLIKPDGVKRSLIGEIINRYERKGMKVIHIKSLKPSKNLIEKHYEEHKNKPFYPRLIEYLASDIVVAFIAEGNNAINCVRMINGATKYTEALPGTIRGDFANEEIFNLVHASDSKASAEKEIKLWFSENINS